MSEEEFVFPKLELGDLVLTARDLSDLGRVPGTVMRVNARSADIYVGGTCFIACRHRSDPDILIKPDLIDSTRIFEMAPMHQKIEALTRITAEMARDIKEVRKTKGMKAGKDAAA